MEESYENTVTQGNMFLVKGHLFHKLDIVEDAGVQKNNHPGDDAVPADRSPSIAKRRFLDKGCGLHLHLKCWN